MLDEVDKLLDMGFYQNVKDIQSYLPPGKYFIIYYLLLTKQNILTSTIVHQRALFTATITDRVLEVGNLKPNKAVVSTIKEGEITTNSTCDQVFLNFIFYFLFIFKTNDETTNFDFP